MSSKRYPEEFKIEPVKVRPHGAQALLVGDFAVEQLADDHLVVADR